jgi:hypothetical protein
MKQPPCAAEPGPLFGGSAQGWTLVGNFMKKISSSLVFHRTEASWRWHGERSDVKPRTSGKKLFLDAFKEATFCALRPKKKFAATTNAKKHKTGRQEVFLCVFHWQCRERLSYDFLRLKH